MTERLHPEDIEEIVARIAGSGASVTVADPRVNGAIKWAAGILSATMIAAMIWVAGSINDLNRTLTRVATQNEAMFMRIDDHETRIRVLERRP